jgi:hypothetical protein
MSSGFNPCLERTHVRFCPRGVGAMNVTPVPLYLRRREFLALGAGGVVGGAAMSLSFAPTKTVCRPRSRRRHAPDRREAKQT